MTINAPAKVFCKDGRLGIFERTLVVFTNPFFGIPLVVLHVRGIPDTGRQAQRSS